LEARKISTGDRRGSFKAAVLAFNFGQAAFSARQQFQPQELYAIKIHAYWTPADKVYAYKIHSHEMPANKMHGHGIDAYGIHYTPMDTCP
jgi:hypothetical protein